MKQSSKHGGCFYLKDPFNIYNLVTFHPLKNRLVHINIIELIVHKTDKQGKRVV